MLNAWEPRGLGVDEVLSPEIPDEATAGEPAGMLREWVILPLPVP